MEAKKARVELCAQFDTPFRKQANTVLLHNQRIRAAHQQNETLPTAHRKSVDEVMRQLEKNLKKLSGDRTKSSDLVDVTSQLSRQLNSFRKSFEGSNDGVCSVMFNILPMPSVSCSPCGHLHVGCPPPVLCLTRG